MNSKKKDRVVLKTVIACLVVLFVFFVQGAVVVVGQLEGLSSILSRGGILWGAAILTLLFFLVKDKGIAGLGFRKMNPGSAKKFLYFLPILVVALSHLIFGIDRSDGIKIVLANLFFTLAIGMIEELYFRGIICGLLLRKGVAKAVIISAVLFGLAHLMNVMGGAHLVETILQILFAFTYGLVFAVIFYVGGSIVPCLLLHALHDFCSFISADGSLALNIAVGTVQFLILLIYFIYLIKKEKIFARKEA
ncbi:MAG: CPBP family intramembrane metalloprotease [Lachnospiraceae bacterium]|nr:CPBP family intramembrane metalloprotease [Lachnospiraceae bacterium]